MSVPATLGDDFETGLEDFGMEDAVIPRLTIVHKEGQFKDSLSNETFPTLRAIILGLVKQRVLWHQIMDDGDWPMCRSANHEVGLPNLSDEQPKEKRFPWEKSGFDPAHYPPEEDGKIRLPCSGCQLKEWKTHPDGKRPYCTEQFTLPVLYDPREDDNWVPALITFQKTGLKPLKSYLTSFARSRSAAFQAITEITLNMEKRGTTDYSVPSFKRIGDTDETMWREYSVNFRTMKDFLVAEPGSRDDDEAPAAPSDNTAKAPTVEKQDDKSEDIVEAQVVEDKPEQAAKVSEEPKAEEAPKPAQAEDDDDLPF